MYQFSWLFLCWTCVIVNVISYRLPTSVIPTHYKLEILSYLGEPDNFNFDGRVWIQVTCLQPTQNITLHSKDLAIGEDVTVKDISNRDDVKDVKIKYVESQSQDDFLMIHLDNDLHKDHSYEIFVPFNGTMIDSLRGFYRSSYVDQRSKEKKWLGVTQFEPTSARQAFPCFDEPAMKAVFEIILGRNENYSTISNMPLSKTEPIKEKKGWVWDTYMPSVPMSTYLVAFMVSDFGNAVSPPTKNNVTFKVWARKDALDQVNLAKSVGPKFLEYYEDFFDIKYPLPKQDMVAVPDFSAGAMENWGLITYRESALLYDAKVSSLSSQQRIATVIAHELAHQWFGNLVTMKWWTDLWLNEGFATFMATKAVTHVFPEWNASNGDLVSNVLSLFSFDALKTSHPVSVPIGHPSEIDEIFDTISYKKGSYLIRMMSLFLGEEILRSGVSNYLKKHQYNNAEQDDLWESLTEEAHQKGVLPKNLTVKTIMDTWTLQTGFPIITITRNYENRTAVITQKRFIKDERKPKTDDNCWWVPLSYTNAKELDFNSTRPKSWLSCPKHTLVLEDLPDENTWVLFNIKLSTLYKVNYDERNWKLISDALNSQSHRNISVLDKVQLLDGVFELAWNGDVKYDIVFEMVKYFKFEDEYLPWKTFITNINVLSKYLKKTSIYGDFKAYMSSVIAPIYGKIGGLDIPEEKRTNSDYVKHKIMIVSRACIFEVSGCVSDAQELFKKYQKNPNDKTIIPQDLQSVIFCTAVRHGGEKEWEFLWTQYKKSNVASEKRSILSDLSCTREMWLLRRLLEWSLDDEKIRKQDSAGVFVNVAHNDIGYYLAKQFLYTNIKNIHSHLSHTSRRLSSYVTALGSHTTTEKDYDELQDFVKSSQTYLRSINQGVQQALETARLNVQWQNRHLDNIEKLLHSMVPREKEQS